MPDDPTAQNPDLMPMLRLLATREVARGREVRQRALARARSSRQLCRSSLESADRSIWLLKMAACRQSGSREITERLAIALERLVDYLEGSEHFLDGARQDPAILDLTAKALGLTACLIDSADLGQAPHLPVLTSALDVKQELARLVEQHVPAPRAEA